MNAIHSMYVNNEPQDIRLPIKTQAYVNSSKPKYQHRALLITIIHIYLIIYTI